MHDAHAQTVCSDRSLTVAARPNGAARSRRNAGVSMLEAALSMAMLAMVAATITGSIAQGLRGEQRNTQRLGAYEVANRLILQYLDDPDQVEGLGSGPIDYGRYQYRFELVEVGFAIENSGTGAALNENPGAGVGKNRYRAATVRVWLADSGDPSGTAPAGEYMAELTRLYDPAHLRNPDTFEDEGRIEDLIHTVIGGGG